MNSSIKSIGSLFAISAALLSVSSTALQAAQISGGISFAGDYDPLDSGSILVGDLTLADVLVFGPSATVGNTVVVQTSGDFTSIPNLSITTVASPLQANPAVLPAGPIWSVGGFSLTLTTISQTQTAQDTLKIVGTGIIHSTNPLLSDTPGSFVATFNTIAGTYSWSASSGALPCTGSIGDFVWEDINGNGCQDPGEPGIANQTVSLYRGCATNGTLIQTTTTDANGKYIFTNLCAGEYAVGFNIPFGFSRTAANQTCGVGGLPPDQTDSDCDCGPDGECRVCVVLPSNTSNLSIDCGYTRIPPEEAGCRTTGGGRQETSYPAVEYVTHGGQVGAPVGKETEFDPDSVCIQGNWEHVRHVKSGNDGNFHAKSFDSLLCACLGCPQDPTAPVTINGLCNPDMRICGPEPRKAPANKLTFSGVGDFTMTNGKKDPRSVVFRVDLEDRSEPGNSSSGGSVPPNDRHRIRIWILTTAELAKLNNPADRLLTFRQAIAAKPSNVVLKDGAESAPGVPVANGTAVFGVRAPDIDDGSEMTTGNHQIHPAIKPCL